MLLHQVVRTWGWTWSWQVLLHQVVRTWGWTWSWQVLLHQVVRTCGWTWSWQVLLHPVDRTCGGTWSWQVLLHLVVRTCGWTWSWPGSASWSAWHRRRCTRCTGGCSLSCSPQLCSWYIEILSKLCFTAQKNLVLQSSRLRIYFYPLLQRLLQIQIGNI